MFNARQRLRLFPTPTDADWLHVGTVVSSRLSAEPCGRGSLRTRFLLPSTRPLSGQGCVASLEEEEEKASGSYT